MPRAHGCLLFALLLSSCGGSSDGSASGTDSGLEVGVGVDAAGGSDAGLDASGDASVDALADAPKGATKGRLLAVTSQTSCAVREGKVWCWGGNNHGELGVGTRVDSKVPAVVGGVDSALEVVGGSSYFCARTEAGTVFCWGDGMYGTLGFTPPSTCGTGGDGSPFPCAMTAQAVPGVTDVVELAASSGVACARHGDGSVTCWGGVGKYVPGSTSGNPPQKMLLDGAPLRATHVAGGLAMCIWATDKIRCVSGETYTTPEWVGLEAAWYVPLGRCFSCVGTVVSTATSTFETITEGGSPAGRFELAALGGTTALTGGNENACALRAAGGVWCWGRNQQGGLGSGTFTDRYEPGPVVGLDDAVQLSRGLALHHCALRPGNVIVCWGANDHGQLGPAAKTSAEPSPVEVTF
jgi:hypothetical protein